MKFGGHPILTRDQDGRGLDPDGDFARQDTIAEDLDHTVVVFLLRVIVDVFVQPRRKLEATNPQHRPGQQRGQQRPARAEGASDA